jgi:hypothetical protein
MKMTKPTLITNALSSLVWAVLILFLSSCSNHSAQQNTSSFTIQFPNAKDTSAHATGHNSALASAVYAFSPACFAINVTASDIANQKQNTCDVPIGIFQGFVAPGATVTVTVPQGHSRKLEIFAYLRTSSADACPSGQSDLGGLDRTRLVRVNDPVTFDAMSASVDVTVNLNNPGNSQNLISQYSLPKSCVPPTAPNLPAAAVSAGQAALSGGNYTMTATVSGKQNEVVLHGGAYRLQLSRTAQ